MKRNIRNKGKPAKNRGILEQTLSSDYWEGYYALTDGNIVKCMDTGEDSAEFTVFSIKTGEKTTEGTFPFGEETLFAGLADSISKASGSKLYLRVSDECGNPDRHDEIDRILAEPDGFELLRLQNLIKCLKNRSISIFGGTIGSQDLSEGEFGGFYRLSDGLILYCRNLNNWEDDKVNRIVDGVLSYRILDPSLFDASSSTEHFFGFLQGDRFSAFLEELAQSGRKVTGRIAEAGSELCLLLEKAMNGDAGSAAIASHRLKANIIIRH